MKSHLAKVVFTVETDTIYIYIPAYDYSRHSSRYRCCTLDSPKINEIGKVVTILLIKPNVHNETVATLNLAD